MEITNGLALWTKRLATVALFAASVGAWATTYYVDFASGVDTNNGTSTFTPWKHCPGDSNAANVAISTTLIAGDTVIFKGGVQYTGVIAMNFSGSSGSPITYDGNSAGTFGSGQAIIDEGGIQNRCIIVGNISYVTINDFELRNITNSGNIIHDSSGSSYVTVSNCVLHIGGTPPSNPSGGSGIFSCVQSTYWTIANNLFYDCYNAAMWLSPVSYFRIYGNEIHDKCVWGILIGNGLNLSSTGNSIHNNSIHDLFYYLGLGPHVDYIFISNTGTGITSNTSIYDNLFYDTNVFNNGDPGATAFIFMADSGENGSGGQINNTYIWNNVFSNVHALFSIRTDSNNGPGGGNFDGLYIYENSFYSPSGQVSHILLNEHAGPYVHTNVYVKNNIGQKVGGSNTVISIGNQTWTSLFIDYNCWYDPGDSTPFGYKTSYYSWASWQAAGFDVHGLDVDPKYTNPTIAVHDLSLQISSPCIDTGVALGSPYNMDILGVSRPQGLRWDMGAYESPLSGTKPTAPTGLRIKN